MSELLYLSGQKLYGRLGVARITSNTEAKGSIKLPPVTPALELSATRTKSIGGEGPDSRSALTKGIKRIEKLHNPTEFPSRNLRPNQWVKFDLDMAQAAVHEDCATAPADNYIRPGHDLCEGFA